MGRTWGFFQEKLIQEGDEYKRTFIVEWPEKALDELMIPEAGQDGSSHRSKCGQLWEVLPKVKRRAKAQNVAVTEARMCRSNKNLLKAAAACRGLCIPPQNNSTFLERSSPKLPKASQ